MIRAEISPTLENDLGADQTNANEKQSSLFEVFVSIAMSGRRETIDPVRALRVDRNDKPWEQST